MTQFNILKSQQEKETQSKIVINLEKEINAKAEHHEEKLKNILDMCEKDYNSLKGENHILRHENKVMRYSFSRFEQDKEVSLASLKAFNENKLRTFTTDYSNKTYDFPSSSRDKIKG